MKPESNAGYDVHRLMGGVYWATLCEAPATTLQRAKRRVYWPDDPAYIEDRETGQIVAYAAGRVNGRRRWRACARKVDRRALNALRRLLTPRARADGETDR